MRLSRIACALCAVLAVAPAFAASFVAPGVAIPATVLVKQVVTFSFPVSYRQNEKTPCGIKVQFGDTSPPQWLPDSVQYSQYPATYTFTHAYAKASTDQPYGGVYLATVVPEAHGNVPACGGNGSTAKVTVNAPITIPADLAKGTTPPVVSSVAAPAASVVPTISTDVANVAGTYGMSVKLKGHVKSTVAGFMTGYKMSFEVDGKTIGSETSDANGAASIDLNVTESLAVGAHTLKLVALAADGKSYQSTANLDIVKTETSLNFSLGYPTNSKLVEQETAITFKGQLKRNTDSGDTGPAGRKVVLLLDGKGIGHATTDATGHYTHAYTIPRDMATTEHTAEVAFDGDTHYLATAAPKKETFTVKVKPRLPPHTVNTPAATGSGIY